MPVSLADEVLVERAGADGFVLQNELPRGNFDCPDEDNLALKAVKLMRKLTGCTEPVSLTLVKRIPLGAGLGGGSADAAATLRALNELWSAGFTREELADASAELGSDVPALTLGGAVMMEGRGERVCQEPLYPQFDLVLAFPRTGCSTRKVYAFSHPRLTNGGEIVDNMRSALVGGSPARLASALQNDLEEAAGALNPEIAHVRAALLEAGALGAMMTGSGSCVFGIASNAAQAEAIVGKLDAAGIIAKAAHTCPVM